MKRIFYWLFFPLLSLTVSASPIHNNIGELSIEEFSRDELRAIDQLDQLSRIIVPQGSVIYKSTGGCPKPKYECCMDTHNNPEYCKSILGNILNARP